MLVVIILGGIYAGIFTPTEAAAVSAVYAFFIAVFVYRDITIHDVPRVLVEASKITVMLMFIIASAFMFAFLLTTEQIPQMASEFIVGMGLPVWGFSACSQRPASDNRQFHGANIGRADPDADNFSDCDGNGHRPDTSWSADDCQHANRFGDAASGPESVCDSKCGRVVFGGHHQSIVSMVVGTAGRTYADYLRTLDFIGHSEFAAQLG